MIPFFCLQVQDQIDVTKQLVDLYPFIDKSRVSRYFPREYFRYILAASHLCTLLFLPFFYFSSPGGQLGNWESCSCKTFGKFHVCLLQVAIWGWSYGGFVTASVLAADADQSNIFKVSSYFLRIIMLLLVWNYLIISVSSAASALPLWPTGSTMTPSTLRGGATISILLQPLAYLHIHSTLNRAKCNLNRIKSYWGPQALYSTGTLACPPLRTTWLATRGATSLPRWRYLNRSPSWKQSPCLALSKPLLCHQARKLANKKYLMVHGTADDNVHYQQSMMLARAMEEADVLFRQLSSSPSSFSSPPSIASSSQPSSLQATLLPGRSSRPRRTSSPLLPRSHWLPPQRLLRAQWGGLCSITFCPNFSIYHFNCNLYRCWAVSWRFESASNAHICHSLEIKTTLVCRVKTDQSHYNYTKWAIFWAEAQLRGFRKYLLTEF